MWLEAVWEEKVGEIKLKFFDSKFTYKNEKNNIYLKKYS